MRIAFVALVTLSTALATLVTGCVGSTRYTYRPTRETKQRDAPGDVAGSEAAAYPVPKLTTRGDVQVATLGVDKQKRLHVRLVARNGGGDPWTIASADQRATIDGSSPLRLAEARCDGLTMPEAVVMPGDTRTIDLYYELPPPFADAARIPQVRVDWRVRTPSGALASDRAAFERRTVPPPPPVPVDAKQIARDLDESRRDWGSGCPQSVALARSAVCGATF